MTIEKIYPCNFYIEIEAIETARFQKCDGLEAITDVIEVEEGGLNKTHKFLPMMR